MRDLFPDEPEQPTLVPTRKLVATYDYTDEQGKLLYQTCRFAPKDFRARRPDGNGGWIHSVEGVRLVSYRLRTLLKFNGVVVTSTIS